MTMCYAIEGNVVDRNSAKNGKGWCEDVSPTLNTQDRHAICFQLCGDRGDPSVSTSEKAYCIPANPMSDRTQAVCIALEGNGSRPSHMGKGFSEDGTMYTLNTIEQHSVCYGISRSCLKGGEGSNGGMPVGEDTMPSMTANGTGAVVYPINLMVATRGGKDDMRTCFGVGEPDDPQFTLSAAHEHGVCYAIENHPADSRVTIDGSGIVQTLSARMGTGGNNTPMVLIRGNDV